MLFFLVARPLTPPPPLRGRATKKKNFYFRLRLPYRPLKISLVPQQKQNKNNNNVHERELNIKDYPRPADGQCARQKQSRHKNRSNLFRELSSGKIFADI